jgi:NADH dehydrogenase (ubiquinone) Fe-S protein 1
MSYSGWALCPFFHFYFTNHSRVFFFKVASRSAAYDIGFVPSKKASITTPKFIYLLNADELDPKSIPRDAFVVYQGHHGDLGAQLADVCLPAAAYTEKSTTWVNAEGRAQLGRAAVPPPGASREDWKIIRYVVSLTCLS